MRPQPAARHHLRPAGRGKDLRRPPGAGIRQDHQGLAFSKKRRVRGSGRYLCALRRALHRRPLCSARCTTPSTRARASWATPGIPQPQARARSRAPRGGDAVFGRDRRTAPAQLNKLLKVLEDRKVMFESAYYSRTTPPSPLHPRHFQNGMPADFRLVAAHHQVPARHPRSHPLPLHRALFQAAQDCPSGGHRPQRRRTGRHGHRAGGGKKGRQFLLFGA